MKRKRKNKKISFAEKVYTIVKKIPRGKIMTYKEVAKRVGSPLAWRAVGNILNKNKNPKVPCHRVVRSDKRIGGYRDGTSQKISLLKKEGITIKKGKLIN